MAVIVPSAANAFEAPAVRSPLGLKHGLLQLASGGMVAFYADSGPDENIIGSSYCGAKTGASWSQATLTVPTGWVNGTYCWFNACIDKADGLHMAYVDGSHNVQYVYWKYWSATQTFGLTSSNNAPFATKTLFTMGTGTKYPRYIDLDTPGTTDHKHTVVGVYFDDVSNNAGSSYSVYVVDDTTNTVVGTLNQTMNASGNSVSVSEDISLACVKTGTASTNTTIQFAMTTTRNMTTADANTQLQSWTFTISGATFSAGASVSIPDAGFGGGKRRYFMFCPDNSNVFTLAGAGYTAYQMVYSFTFTSSTVLTPRVNVTIDNTSHSNSTTNATAWGVNFYNDHLAFYAAHTNGNAYTMQTATINADGTVTWYRTGQKIDTTPSGWTTGVVVGGTNRNFYGDMNVEVFNNASKPSGQNYRIDHSKIYAPSATVTGTLPYAAPALTQTSFPTLQSRFHLLYDYPQARWKLQWQFATDAAFSSVFYTATQSDTDLQTPTNTGPTNADVRGSYTIPDHLGQGTFYIRSRAINEYGGVSPWSSGYSFTVSHPSTPSGLVPNNDQIVPFGTGLVYFDWTFSDPSPSDYQTAYRIVVTRVSDGAAVVDTGKVTGADSIGSATIPSGFKDVELQWSLYTWDSDDVSSLAVGPATFYASDAPAPAITAPVDGSSITTGRPNITWTPGIAGTKTMVSYRVQITQGTVTIWDTGTVAGVASSVTVPPGILHNNNNYSMKLTIKDSLNQVGVANSTFTTSYVQPATVTSTVVYLYEFDRKGFVYIGWNYATRDADFLSWNVYRQEIGGTDVTLLAQFTEMRPVYGFRDYSAKGNTRYLYWVTQSVNRSGDVVESATTNVLTVTTPGSTYWLMDSLGVVDPVPLFNVTGDSWTDEHEVAVMTVLGRGRHQDEGESLGPSGTLSLQLRDKYVGLTAGSNWLSNPALQIAADGINPDNWTLSLVTGTNLNNRYDSFIEPCPSGKYGVYTHGADTISTGGYIQASNTNAKIDLTKTDLFGGGKTAYVSAWYAQPPASAFTPTVKVNYTFYAADGTTVVGAATEVTMPQIDTYEPASSGDTSVGNWKRYGVSITVPVNCYFLKLEYRYYNLTGSTVNNALIYLGGFMLNSGSSVIPFFDGDTYGGYWNTGVGSGSTTTGYFTAQQQRLTIENARELKRPMYLRTPFGDVLYVGLGDEGADRIPGVGSAAYVDYSLPYFEVAY